MGVQPQHGAERHGILQAVFGREAEPRPQSVRRRVRRPRRSRQGFLLRQLRRIPAGAEDRDLREHPDDGAAPGRHGQAGSQPRHQRVVCGWHRAAERHHELRPPGARRAAGANARRRLEQLRLPASPPGLQRQVRHQVRSAVQLGDQRVRAFQLSRRRQLRAAADPGDDQQSVERLCQHPQPAVGDRCHANAGVDVPARGPRRRVADEGRQDRDRHGHAKHVRHVRDYRPADRHRVCRRADTTVRERLDRVGPPEQQPAVPGSPRLGCPHQLLMDARPAHVEVRLRISAHQH